MSIRAKLMIASAVMIAAVGYLAYAGMSSGFVYYLEVDQYLADPQYHAQRVRLHGTVSDEGFNATRGTLLARFNIAGMSGDLLAVSYRGAVPDMFEAGRDVIVEGRRDAETGVFEADVLLTKCASKYEAEQAPDGGAAPQQHPDSIPMTSESFEAAEARPQQEQRS